MLGTGSNAWVFTPLWELRTVRLRRVIPDYRISAAPPVTLVEPLRPAFVAEVY